MQIKKTGNKIAQKKLRKIKKFFYGLFGPPSWQKKNDNDIWQTPLV